MLLSIVNSILEIHKKKRTIINYNQTLKCFVKRVYLTRYLFFLCVDFCLCLDLSRAKHFNKIYHLVSFFFVLDKTHTKGKTFHQTCSNKCILTPSNLSWLYFVCVLNSFIRVTNFFGVWRIFLMGFDEKIHGKGM